MLPLVKPAASLGLRQSEQRGSLDSLDFLYCRTLWSNSLIINTLRLHPKRAFMPKDACIPCFACIYEVYTHHEVARRLVAMARLIEDSGMSLRTRSRPISAPARAIPDLCVLVPSDYFGIMLRYEPNEGGALASDCHESHTQP